MLEMDAMIGTLEFVARSDWVTVLPSLISVNDLATGDIVVFGRLAGIAHAGAGGDEQARIFALDLAATQLRIATFIAADQDSKRRAQP